MKTLLTLFAFAFSVSAWAHIDVGTHTGSESMTLSSCKMTVLGQSFLNNEHHPLNERIEIVIGEDKFTVGHPYEIQDASTPASVKFNHDLFQGVLATKDGAKALTVHMSHEGGKEGPKSFTYTNHNWRTGESTSFTCRDLKHTSN